MTLARAQHAAYVAGLRDALGLEVIALAADDGLPDCAFVEDMAVVAGERALITRSGHPERRAESAAVAVALRACELELHHMVAPACLDGGDVLLVGQRFFVGRSLRTNDAGIEALRAAFEPLGYAVEAVAVAGALHLKSLCSAPREDLVLVAEGAVDPARFEAVADVVVVPREEAYAANTLGAGGRALVPAGFRQTQELLAQRGVEPVVLETSEIRKADAALTCMSVVF